MTLSSLFNAAQRQKEESDFAAFVRQAFAYDDTSGELLTRYTRKPFVKTDHNGYGYVILHGRRHSSAKLVWVLHHNAFPPSPLKHTNGDRTDDRIENLGARILDGTVEGSGSRWVVRPKGFTRRNDVIGVYRTFEKALAATERHQRGEDLV